MKTGWQENKQEERVERNREIWLGRGTAQLPVLSSGVSPESARRRGTAQYQVPGGLHDHLKTGVSRTRCKSLLVPLSRATYGVSLHIVLVRRDQTCSAKPPSPGAFACLSCLVSLSTTRRCRLSPFPVYTNRASRATRGTRHVRKWSMHHHVPFARIIVTFACFDLSFPAWYGFSKGIHDLDV